METLSPLSSDFIMAALQPCEVLDVERIVNEAARSLQPFLEC